MRTKSSRQGYLDFVWPSSGKKVVREYRAKYEGIDRVLRANPVVLDLVSRDSFFSARGYMRYGRSYLVGP